MKRAVHALTLIEDKALCLGWHRYTDDGQQLPGGYTGNTEPYGISPQAFDALFPGSSMLLDCMASIKATARSIVEAHERETWQQYGITDIEIVKVYACIPRNRYALAYSANNAPDIEIDWHRVRDGKRLPAWCDGILLYEHRTDEHGLLYATVNVNKGVLRSPTIAAQLASMLEVCVPIVDALDREYGIDDYGRDYERREGLSCMR